VKEFSVNIIGLSNKVHQFEYLLGDSFFDHYGKNLLSGGEFKAEIALDKHETFIEADFVIIGKARLICDKSLEPFDLPLKLKHKIVFKFGDEEKEVSDEIMIIPRDKDALELGQFIYEFIGLAIPLKKVHPRFQNEEEEDDDSEGKIIYTSGPAEDEPETIDPRWEKLKKLK
jgi:Predicted metal-binding, possibly nucleic acid-binding protein